MCQTVLSFDQNLSETLENATQIENNHYIKDNMSQVCCLQFSFLIAFEIENSIGLWWNIIKTLCGQYGSNRIVRIVSWLEHARNIAKLNIDQLYVMLIKIDQNLLNDNMDQPILSLIKIFQKYFK